MSEEQNSVAVRYRYFRVNNPRLIILTDGPTDPIFPEGSEVITKKVKTDEEMEEVVRKRYGTHNIFCRGTTPSSLLPFVYATLLKRDGVYLRKGDSLIAKDETAAEDPSFTLYEVK